MTKAELLFLQSAGSHGACLHKDFVEAHHLLQAQKAEQAAKNSAFRGQSQHGTCILCFFGQPIASTHCEVAIGSFLSGQRLSLTGTPPPLNVLATHIQLSGVVCISDTDFRGGVQELWRFSF